MEDKLLEGVREVILVLSGKGGVGKSTVSVQLASSLRALGQRVGILDIDLCGPSIPRMLGVEAADVMTNEKGQWIPVKAKYQENLFVISLAFFLESKNQAVIWRGPKKNAMIKQLLSKVAWDNIDYLVIDTPPGTSDEHISLAENLREASGVPTRAVLVTTPQRLSTDDVVRQVTFCKRANLDLVGIIENMAGFQCPNCKECTNIYAFGGGEILATENKVEFLGRIPLWPPLAKAAEEGKFLREAEGVVSESMGGISESKGGVSEASQAFENIARKLIEKSTIKMES